MPSDSEAVRQGAIQILNTVTQALPTNGSTPLVAAGAVAVPTTPASALQVVAPQPLAVMNPNQYQSGVPAPSQPFYKRPLVIAPIVLGVVGLGAVFLMFGGKKKKR